MFEIKNEIITHNIDAPIFKNIEHLLKIADAVESKYKVYNTIVQYAIDVKTELDKEVKLFDISKTFLNTHTIDDEKV
ncbi:MAG: hypothetical protein IKO36_00885 [Bacteroidaceae bacterium]|nr:hypothetical protein [Bacteroidaceae bacterium]